MSIRPLAPAPPSSEGGRAASVQEEPRGVLSLLLGVAESPAGSIVIYLCVCVCVCVCVCLSSVVGRLDLSESRSTRAMSTMWWADWT